MRRRRLPDRRGPAGRTPVGRQRVPARRGRALQAHVRGAEVLIGAFLDGGHAPVEAGWRTWSLVYVTIGLAQEEQAAGATRDLDPLLRAATADRSPSLAAAIGHFGDFEDRFRHGLGLLVSGREIEG